MSSNSDLSVIANLPLELEEFANIGVWHYDLRSGEITWSTGLYHIYELDKGDFDGTFETYQQHVHPEDIELVHKQIETAIANKSTFSFLKRIITGKGEYKTLKTWGTVKLSKTDEVERISGFSSDITDAINAEKALIESSEFNKKLIDNTQNAILIYNHEGEILFANKTAADLIKANSVEDLIGRNVKDFTKPENHKVLKERIKQTLETGDSSSTLEYEFICLDGAIKIGESKIIPYNFYGQPALLGIVSDITHQKEALRALENSEEQIRFLI